VTAPSHPTEPAPGNGLSAPEGFQNPDPGTERRPGGEFGPQTGAEGREALREQYAAALTAELTRYARTDIDPGTGSDVGDQVAIVLAVRDREMEQLRADANAWRHKAIRRALAISRLRGTIDACTDLASEEITARTEWGDGYRAAIADLREVLREFGHLQPGAGGGSEDGPAATEATELRTALAEALACLYSLERVGGSVIGYQTVNVIPPTRYDRWQAVLDGKEQP
jgi:hypothetical protein